MMFKNIAKRKNQAALTAIQKIIPKTYQPKNLALHIETLRRV